MKSHSLKKLLLFFTVLTVLLSFSGAGTFSAQAATSKTKLKAPQPYMEDPEVNTFVVSWERTAHTGSYEVKLLLNGDEDKKVTRTYTTTSNKVDLTLFAAGCTVEVYVRSVPSSSATSKYQSSDWGVCEEAIEPADDNQTMGYAGVSSGRYYLEGTDGKKLSGWQKVNGWWYYFDPNNKNLSSVGWATVNQNRYYFTETGKMQSGWLLWENHWYFLEPGNGRMVTGWFQAAPNSPFYFTENATAEQPLGSLNEAVTNASYPNSKPPYSPAQSGSASPASSTPGSTSQTAAQTAWKTNPDGSWSYVKAGKTVKSSWEQIDGFWYYFNEKGIMQTGWQYINSRWYYLEPNANGSNGYKCGAMWVNATTPDGYTVNGDGMWVRDGQPVTDKASGSSVSSVSSAGTGSTGKTITSCRVTVSVTDAGTGNCRKASVTSATNCTIKSQKYSQDYSSWTPGTAVTILVELEPAAGYTFGGTVTFSCSGATYLGQSSTTGSNRVVRLSYTPVMQLAAPEMMYVTENNELKWVPVFHARRYRVQATGGGNTSTVSQYVTSASVDIQELGNPDSDTMSITVTALGADGSKAYLESKKTTISDLEAYSQDHRLDGTFTRSDTGRVRYVDENGEALTGWQQLLGYWYHFRSNGYADGPGWYQENGGYWYYFDENCRMVTGNITENGTTYFLNDGSRTDLPLGAWVQ